MKTKEQIYAIAESLRGHLQGLRECGMDIQVGIGANGKGWICLYEDYIQHSIDLNDELKPCNYRTDKAYRYITSITDKNFDEWDVYGVENNPEYYDDYIAVTGPKLFLSNLYKKSQMPDFKCDVKTDSYRGIDVIQAGTLSEIEDRLQEETL